MESADKSYFFGSCGSRKLFSDDQDGSADNIFERPFVQTLRKVYLSKSHKPRQIIQQDILVIHNSGDRQEADQ